MQQQQTEKMMNASTNNWAVYDKDGNRVALYNETIPPHSQFGSAQGNARRHAARLGTGYSHCKDRGPNRWESLYIVTEETEEDWSEDEATEVEPITDDEIYEQRKENIKAENELLQQFGIVPSGNYVSRGTASDDNVRLRNENFNKLPHITDASMLDVANVIDDEKRQDHIVLAQSLWMKSNGVLVSDQTEIGLIEERAFRQLLSRIGVFPSSYQAFKMWPIGIVADTFNDVIEHYKNNTHHFWNEKKEQYLAISIGTRLNTAINNKRTVYRVVSTSYQGGMNCSDMLKATQNALKDFDGRVDISYNPETTKVQADVLWQKEYKTERSLVNPMCEGSVFQFGIRITSADAANHRFLIQPIARRDKCNNCQLISTEKGFLVEKRHIGDLEAIKAAMFGDVNEQGAINESMELIEPMLRQWGYLENTPVNSVSLWGMKFKESKEASATENALKWAIKNEKIGKGIAKKVLLDVILTNLEKEPSPCLDGIINAITRAAHESLLDDIERSLLEKQAGELIPVLAH